MIFRVSPFWETELTLMGADVQVDERSDYIVVRSARYRDHIWKNFILFPEMNDERDELDRWRLAYQREFPERDFSVALGWIKDKLNTLNEGRLLQIGFRVDRSIVVSARLATAPSYAVGQLELARVMRDETWTRVMNRRISMLSKGDYRDLQERFERDKFEMYRRLNAQGRGYWYLASLNGREVGDMGIFLSAEGRARFQEVLVYPPDRNKGIGRTLVYLACTDFGQSFAPSSFVALVDAGSEAERVYNAVGLAQIGTQCRAYWHQYMAPLTWQLQ